MVKWDKMMMGDAKALNRPWDFVAPLRAAAMAGMLLLGAWISPAQAATELYSVISSGNGNAGLVTVDPATGQLLGGHYFQQSGSEFTFDRIGDIAFAPDGTLYSVISSGNGNAGLVTVDPASGQLLGGHYFQQSGSEFTFDRIGDIAFSPELVPIGGAVPEPGTWAMLICGLGMVGATLRRRGVQARIAQAA
jgi:hypothetical protein